MKKENDFTVSHAHHSGLTVSDICKELKIDKRKKPFIWNNELVLNSKATVRCSGCLGNGCYECGYKGKRVMVFPELLATNEQIETLTPIKN